MPRDRAVTRPLSISARQITAICKGAAKAGFVAEIIINGTLVRLVPEARASRPIGATVAKELDEELEGWDEYHRRQNIAAIGSRGYPLGSGRKGDPIQEWYDKLGFDPRTMGESEMRELQKAAEEKWKASIPGTPLQKREKQAIQQLAAHGPNVPVDTSKIKNCGPETQERLKARAYLDTLPHKRYPDSVGFLILTDAGYAAFQAFSASLASA